MADKRVDGAFAVSADKRICLHRFKAVEAANAAADSLSVNSLFGPVRVGDVRSAEGNEVLNAVLELLLRLLGRADEVCRYDGDRHGVLDGLGHIFSPARLKRASS